MTGWDVAYLCLAICFVLVVAIHTIIWSRIYANRLNDLRQTKYKFDKEYECLKEYEKKHEKDLEVLETIKKKKVNMLILMGSDTLEEYNKHPLTFNHLTETEFNKFKEWLEKWKKKYYMRLHDCEEQELQDLMSLLNVASALSNGKGIKVYFKDKEIVLLTSLFKEMLERCKQ